MKFIAMMKSGLFSVFFISFKCLQVNNNKNQLVFGLEKRIYYPIFY